MTKYVVLYLEDKGEQYFLLEDISSVNLKYWDIEHNEYCFNITTKDNKTYIAGTIHISLANGKNDITLPIRKDILEKDNEEECILGGLFYLYNKLKN